MVCNLYFLWVSLGAAYEQGGTKSNLIILHTYRYLTPTPNEVSRIDLYPWNYISVIQRTVGESIIESGILPLNLKKEQGLKGFEGLSISLFPPTEKTFSLFCVFFLYCVILHIITKIKTT